MARETIAERSVRENFDQALEPLLGMPGPLSRQDIKNLVARVNRGMQRLVKGRVIHSFTIRRRADNHWCVIETPFVPKPGRPVVDYMHSVMR